MPAEPVLHGKVFLGDTVLTRGTVVLHHVSQQNQGEVDSVRVARDGTFSIRLPSVPDPGRSEVYFASVRHAGILYFGSPINLPVQLDSLYEIHAYDTLTAPPGGADVPVEARNVFVERDSASDNRWQVTDLFALRNDRKRTLVAQEGGVVWSYPLAARATDATVAQAQFAGTAASVEDGSLVVRTPLPPGERLFVVRYFLPDPYIQLPIPATIEGLDVLVREPAPPLDPVGLTHLGPVELEPGTTYMRFNATDVSEGMVRLTEGQAPPSPPVRWFAIILGFALGATAVWAIQSRRKVATVDEGAATATALGGRQQLVLEIARLDESFQANPSPSAEERGAYESRRRELMRRLRAVS